MIKALEAEFFFRLFFQTPQNTSSMNSFIATLALLNFILPLGGENVCTRFIGKSLTSGTFLLTIKNSNPSACRRTLLSSTVHKPAVGFIP
jgi:hypothetical protein